MSRPALTLAVFLVCVGTLPAAADAESSAKEWKRLGKRIVAAFEDDETPPEEKVALAAEVAADGDARRSAKLLIRMAEDLVEREAESWEEAGKMVDAIVRGRWTPACRQRISVLLESAWNDRADAMRLADGMAQGPAKLRQAVVTAARKRKDGLMVRIATRMMSHHPGDEQAHDFILSVLVGAEDPRIRLAALRALEHNADAWSALIADRVADEHWTVQVEAARISAENGLGESIGEMVDKLSCAAPRVQEGFVGALQVMTKQHIGMFPERWRSWWKTNAKYFGPTARPADGPICLNARYPEFYDLEIRSNRVVFVIDMSDSMANWAVERILPDGRVIKSTDFTRIQLLRNNLIRSIRDLDDGVEFNIVAFGDDIAPWQKRMAVANEKTRAKAIKWVEKLKPDGKTTMFGALHWVFGCMGFGDGTATDLTADTIVLLSDGSPLDGWPAGRGPEARLAVLQAVNEWNRKRLVVIHTVALKGQSTAIEFLRTLAETHNGHMLIR